MTLGTQHCAIKLVSETGRRLVEAGDREALVAFSRQVLACPRLRECPYGDYCTIFVASLLSEEGRVHPDGEDQ